MKKFFTLIAAVFASVNLMAQDFGPNANPNANCEGTDFSFYAAKPNKLADGSANSEIFTGETLTAENGITTEPTGNKCVTVLAAEGAEQDWDAQFWIVIPGTVEVGEHVLIKFKYKADFMGTIDPNTDDVMEEVNIGTQAHGAPGDYHHWACIGDVTFKSEWQTFEYDLTVSGDMAGSNGFHSIAFNLSQGGHNNNITYYFDDLEVCYEKVDESLVKYWKPIVSNSDLEGENMSNYIVRIYKQGDSNPTPVEGVGMDESKGIQIVVPAKQEQTWDSQFFIKMNEAIPAGDLIKVSFDYRASEDTSEAIDTQSHGASAGSYNHYTAIGSMTFGTEWKHFEATQSVSSDQSKEDNPYQHIAFNLAHFDHEVILYLDNITVKHQVLVPAGENPDRIALEEYIANMEGNLNMDNLSGYKCNEEIRSAFEEAYSNCLSLSDDDDYAAALDELTAAESKFNASVKDYTNLQNYIKLINEKAEQAKEAGYADLAVALEEKAEAPQSAWDAEQVGKSEIAEMVDNAAIYAMVREGVMPLIEKGKDVTILMNNSDYRWGNASWTGSVTVRANTAEKWHASFDFSQTLTDMPKGAYTIKFLGFQRHDTNDDGETGVQDAQAYVNDNCKLLIAGEDELYDPFPSSMEAARAAFDAAPEAFTNTMTAILTEAGDMKIGVKGTNGLNWVIWSDWQIIYEGEGVANYAGALEQAIEKAKTVKEQLEATLNAPAIENCDDLTFKAEKMIEEIASTSEADAQAMVDALAAVVVEMQEAAKLVASVDEAFTAFQVSLSDNEETAADDIVARAKAAENKYDDYLNMTTADLKAYAEELAYLTGALKIAKEAYAATEENPVEVDVFENPDFEDFAEVGANHNYPGWSGSGFGTGGGTAGPVAERWNQSSGFNTYVDLAGLPAGKYVLSVDGAYRTSISNDVEIVAGNATTDNEAFLYAQLADGIRFSTSIHNIATGAMTAEEAEAAGIDVSANCSNVKKAIPTGEKDEEGNDITEDVTYYFPDQLFTADQWIKAGKYLNNNIDFTVGEDGKVRVGVTRKGQANDWCFLDNFKLTYYGPDATAIATIEVSKNAQGIYTISGIRVNDTNRAGLYIKNVKKIVVK